MATAVVVSKIHNVKRKNNKFVRRIKMNVCYRCVSIFNYELCIMNYELGNALLTFVNMLCQMAPYLLLGFLMAGVLHVFVPSNFFERHLAKENFKSVLLAGLIGIPLPLCSCGVIPTAISLRKDGASRGATVAFMISTPQIGVDSIIAT